MKSQLSGASGLLHLNGFPEVQQILERSTHRNVIRRPAEDSNTINNVCTVPDNRISQLVSSLKHGMIDVDVNWYSLPAIAIAPPHIRYIDDVVTFRL